MSGAVKATLVAAGLVAVAVVVKIERGPKDISLSSAIFQDPPVGEMPDECAEWIGIGA